MGAKSIGDRGGYRMQYCIAPQIYYCMIRQPGTESDLFPSQAVPHLRNCKRQCPNSESMWSKPLTLKQWGPMYRHGSLEDTKRKIHKIVADRARGILALTGIGFNPCPMEHLKATLPCITPNEPRFGTEEQLLRDAKGFSMPAPGLVWGFETRLVDGA